MKICSVANCGKKHYAKGFCSKHWTQWTKYGYTLERTQRDANEIIIEERLSKICLYDKNCSVIAHALIDTEDIQLVKNFKWYLSEDKSKNWRYPVAHYTHKGKHTNIRLHRLVMGVAFDDNGEEKVVDHINHDTLDCRKQNLRVCDFFANSQNQRPLRGATSKYKGVCRVIGKDRWQCHITVNKKVISLGWHLTEESAALAYNEAALKYFGEYACLNKL